MKSTAIIFAFLMITCSESTTKQKTLSNHTKSNKDSINIIDNYPVKSISIGSYGSWQGNHRLMKITKDSIYYDFGSRANPGEEKRISKINQSYDLKNLIKAEQIADFFKIKSGKSRLPVDGSDRTITVVSGNTSYTVTNGWDSEIFKNISEKLEAIQEKEFPLE